MISVKIIVQIKRKTYDILPSNRQHQMPVLESEYQMIDIVPLL